MNRSALGLNAARPRVGLRRIAVHMAVVLALGLLSGCPSYHMIGRGCPGSEFGPVEQATALQRLQSAGPIEELMAVAEELERCGKLDAMEAYVTEHATGDVRVRLALMLAQTLGRGLASQSALKLLLFKAQVLPESELQGFLLWAGTTLARYPEAEAVLAMAQGAVASGGIQAQMVAAGHPPVLPGPWRPLGGQPIPFYIGNAAHEAIAMYYAAAHGTEVVVANTSPISSILRILAEQGIGPAENAQAAALGKLALRPDITNLTTSEVYEIKPAGAEIVAIALVATYVATFASAGVTMRPGSSGAPGTSGVLPAPAGHILFTSPAPGVISYYYRRGPFGVEAPARQPTHAPQPARAPLVDKETFWSYMAGVTGLTGTALIVYVIVSEGSRVIIPPRNLIPVP